MTQTIELNGKHYDAVSGLPVKSQAKKQSTPSKKSSGVFIDGVRRPVGQAMSAVKKPLVAAQAKVSPKKPHQKAKAAQKVHHRTQRTKTLLRRAVKAPVKAEKPKALSATIAKPTQTVPKPTVKQAERLAKTVPRSTFA